MAEFSVTIVRTITTTVRVQADSAAKARQAVEDYGVAEAWADFPQIDEISVARVKSARRA